MSNLVERLRDASSSPARDTMGIGEHWNLEDEAADEIERNRAAISVLVEMLKLILDHPNCRYEVEAQLGEETWDVIAKYDNTTTRETK